MVPEQWGPNGKDCFGIKDTLGALIYRVEGKSYSLNEKRIIYDSLDNAIACIDRKLFTTRRTHNLYRGAHCREADKVARFTTPFLQGQTSCKGHTCTVLTTAGPLLWMCLCMRMQASTVLSASFKVFLPFLCHIHHAHWHTEQRAYSMCHESSHWLYD